MKLSTKQIEFSLLLAKFIIHLDKVGINVSIGEVFRTDYQQREYLRLGFSKAKRSRHQDKLAADIYFFKNGKLIEDDLLLSVFGDVWKNLNSLNIWGGDFKSLYDPNHFQYT